MKWISVDDIVPFKTGSYLCFMNNSYVKMCYFNGVYWMDMWKSTLDGGVDYWMILPHFSKDNKSDIRNIRKYKLKILNGNNS